MKLGSKQYKVVKRDKSVIVLQHSSVRKSLRWHDVYNNRSFKLSRRKAEKSCDPADKNSLEEKRMNSKSWYDKSSAVICAAE